MPPPRRVGRPRKIDLREVVSSILYMAVIGCQWAMLPREFPPPPPSRGASTLSATAIVHPQVLAATRELEGRDASPTSGVTDSQGVQGPGLPHLQRQYPSGRGGWDGLLILLVSVAA